MGDNPVSNEVAIARLEVNVEYIKRAVDEIKAQSCRDCEAGIGLMNHLGDHKVHSSSKAANIRWLVTTGIAILALAVGVFTAPIKTHVEDRVATVQE